MKEILPRCSPCPHLITGAELPQDGRKPKPYAYDSYCIKAGINRQGKKLGAAGTWTGVCPIWCPLKKREKREQDGK
jgi:hypothetical protein